MSAEIRTVLSNNMDVIANQQFQVFEAMKNKGYYKIKMADANEINQTKTTYSQ